MNNTEARKIIKSMGFKILGKIQESPIKGNPRKQMFKEIWCGTVMCLYVVDNENKTLRTANYFNVDGKTITSYTSEPKNF